MTCTTVLHLHWVCIVMMPTETACHLSCRNNCTVQLASRQSISEHVQSVMPMQMATAGLSLAYNYINKNTNAAGAFRLLGISL